LPQADAIDAAVEVLRKKDEGFDKWCNTDSPEHFFIKNLENVQGDERDVMFLSVGYGPDELGQITMNFGPLNHEDGQRRLNVAITRAREHVKLISSFDPSQIDLSRVREEGVRLLKEYMEVAKRGVDAIPRAIGPGTEGEAESHFEEEVYEALRVKGLQLRKQIGVSGYRIDLGVIDPSQPGRFLLGIECDGATYHSFKTARDRDRLRQQVLENLGWKIHRIWSRDWVQNRQREIDRVLAALK
jgi:very-short-patch-repair endonuclease